MVLPVLLYFHQLTILLLDQAPGEKQADDQETYAYGSPKHNGHSLRCLLP